MWVCEDNIPQRLNSECYNDGKKCTRLWKWRDNVSIISEYKCSAICPLTLPCFLYLVGNNGWNIQHFSNFGGTGCVVRPIIWKNRPFKKPLEVSLKGIFKSKDFFVCFIYTRTLSTVGLSVWIHLHFFLCG